MTSWKKLFTWRIADWRNGKTAITRKHNNWNRTIQKSSNSLTILYSLLNVGLKLFFKNSRYAIFIACKSCWSSSDVYQRYIRSISFCFLLPVFCSPGPSQQLLMSFMSLLSHNEWGCEFTTVFMFTRFRNYLADFGFYKMLAAPLSWKCSKTIAMAFQWTGCKESSYIH